ncbi:MAG: Rne/Rng family ribonuclease [Drouetiella hepatica Uher 2000/2452]|jgi:ribonuclease E|uniref:Rne/Rng family ribonuclease n=1 Tax=Drouetiella hepatica Uher 2000/2452 TaxID=904376 RepID=A0A951UK79_9CYAN|nr:Rne/Rng family ribonuclease [Drouetiella hepatica Uher 2000/2452]
MSKQIIIAEQHRIAAVFSEDQIQELIVAKGNHQVSDIYLGIVENVLPGIDAAFVNIGDSERNGFIHVTDLGPVRLRKSAASITELLAPQQKVLVQIMKEPTGNKGPRLTGNISLPGRYLVLMPFGRGVNLSRRIRSEAERNRLRALAILVKPPGMGLLVRTEAEGMPEEAIIEDLETLQKQWENIQQEALTTRPPSLLNRDDDFIQRVLRDVYSTDVNRIVVDSHTGLKRVKQHLVNWSGGKAPQGVLIDHHRDRQPILEYFRVNAAIREALKPRVDLASGGYIIIERTEALTVIDVNSGSFTRSATARETVLWTNSEAATEIARQLRLRNIAGIIIVDFIDMDARRDQLQVLEQFNKALRSDKARPQIAQLTELGLVELTRKRQGQNIYELFGRPCQTCSSTGLIIHLPGEMDHEIAEPIEASRTATAAESRIPALRDNWERSGERVTERSNERTHERAGFEQENLDLDASADLQELDLTNHPNYQERSKDSRRRRRTRLKVGEPVIRGSVAPTLRSEIETEDEPLPLPVIEEPAPVPRNVREPRPEKPERGRTAARREKPVAEPPQVISVEMTPEEQEIYALMGISPMVLATEPIKDPKSAIISVTLPGQSIRSADVSFSDSTPALELDAEELAEEEFEDREPLTESFAEIQISEPVVLKNAPEVSNQGAEAEDTLSDTDAPRRRRRRRSSVNLSDADTNTDAG